MNQFPRLEGILVSLRESTTRSIHLSDCSVTFVGLQSPYKSHQRVDVALGHGWDQMVIISKAATRLPIRDEKTTVILTPWPETNLLAGDFVSMTLPVSHVKNLFVFPTQMPWWCAEGLLTVSIPSTFDGYDEGGAPQWKHHASIWAVETVGEDGTQISQRLWVYDRRDGLGSHWAWEDRERSVLAHLQDGGDDYLVRLGADHYIEGWRLTADFDAVDRGLHGAGYELSACDADFDCRDERPTCDGCSHDLSARGLFYIRPLKKDDE